MISEVKALTLQHSPKLWIRMASPQIGNNLVIFLQSCHATFDVRLCWYQIPAVRLNKRMANTFPSRCLNQCGTCRVVAKMAYQPNVFAVALLTQAAIVQCNILSYNSVHSVEYESTRKMIQDRKNSDGVFQAGIFPMHLKLNTTKFSAIECHSNLYHLLWNAHSSEFLKPFLIAWNSLTHCRFCDQYTVSLTILKKSKFRMEKRLLLNSLKSLQRTRNANASIIDNKIEQFFKLLAIVVSMLRVLKVAADWDLYLVHEQYLYARYKNGEHTLLSSYILLCDLVCVEKTAVYTKLLFCSPSFVCFCVVTCRNE